MVVANIDEYISSCPEGVRPVLERVRGAIHKAVPGCEETISYGIPTITLNGRYLVYFAAWKHHISVYPIPSGSDEFEQEIAAYRAGKGTLRFPLQQSVPYDLIKRIAVQASRRTGSKG